MSNPRMTQLTRADEINSAYFDSIEWALDCHVNRPDTGEFNFAVLHGNEDAPERIEFWRAEMPFAAPDFVWTPEGD